MVTWDRDGIMVVELRTKSGAGRCVNVREVDRRATNMLHALRLEQAELSVLLCGDSEIRDLNRNYRHIDKATDVLAFPQTHGVWDTVLGPTLPEIPWMLGDVVISVETAARQARQRARPVLDEITFLLAHGLLHLLGCDHRNQDETRRMSARTDMLLAAAYRHRRRGLGR